MSKDKSKPKATLYFAYGSNMCREQMECRCPKADFMGQATLSGFRFSINARTYATIVPELKGQVRGVLWRLNPAEELVLDDYEGVAEGHYTKEFMEVMTARGAGVRAMVYVAANSSVGAPRPRYIQGIVLAARALGFPESYVGDLERWMEI